MPACSGGSREAPDDELGLLATFHLEPAPGATAWLVEGGDVLPDDAFPAALLRAAVCGEPVGWQPARAHQIATARGHDRFERATAFGQRPPQQAHAVPLEAIEDRENRVDPFALRPSLEKLKARDAATVEGDDLAVEHEGAAPEALEGLTDLTVLGGDVVQVARVESNASATIGESADPVVLLLVDPALPVKGLGDERRQHRANQRDHLSTAAGARSREDRRTPPWRRRLPRRRRSERACARSARTSAPPP